METDLVNIFISYSHKNDIWLSEHDKNDRHKSNDRYLLEFWQQSFNKNNVKFWFDSDKDEGIHGGDDWKMKIFNEIDRSDIAILLVTQEFIISPFIREEELPRILERARQGKMEIFPIYLEPADWDDLETIDKFQAVPGKNIPFSYYFDQAGTGWKAIRNDITKALRRVIIKVEEKRRNIEPGGIDNRRINNTQEIRKVSKFKYKIQITITLVTLAAVSIIFILFKNQESSNKDNVPGKITSTQQVIKDTNSNPENKNDGNKYSGGENRIPTNNVSTPAAILNSQIKEIENEIAVGNVKSAENMFNILKSKFNTDRNEYLIELGERLAKLEKMVFIPALHIYIGRYEVTVAEYSSFINLYNKKNPRSKLNMPQLSKDLNGENQPIQFISYDEASIYAAFYKMRLPTLSEWTTSLGINQSDNYIYGSSDPYESGNLGAAKGKNKWNKITSPVGSFKANKYGIYDLIGNVEEWCTKPDSKSEAYVVGGFNNSRPEDLKTEKLGKDIRFSSVKYYNVGFRCVYDPRSNK